MLKFVNIFSNVTTKLSNRFYFVIKIKHDNFDHEIIIENLTFKRFCQICQIKLPVTIKIISYISRMKRMKCFVSDIFKFHVIAKSGKLIKGFLKKT